jgi:hypothetical protein
MHLCLANLDIFLQSVVQGRPLEPMDAQSLCQLSIEDLNTAEESRILRDLGCLIDAIRWDRYVWENARLDEGISDSDLSSAWNAKCHREQVADNQQNALALASASAREKSAREEFEACKETHKPFRDDEKKRFEAIDQLLGVERTFIAKFPEPRASDTAAAAYKHKEWWECGVDFQSPFEGLAYDRRVAKEVHSILKGLRPAVRCSPILVLRCGHSLTQLFDEHKGLQDFQHYYRLREYAELHPADLCALLYVGQCEAILGNEERVRSIAETLWGFCESAHAEDVGRVVWDLLNMIESRDDFSFLTRSDDSFDLAYATSAWNGRENNCLVYAIVDHAFRSDRWSDSLVDTLLSFYPYDDEVCSNYIPSHALLGYMARMSVDVPANNASYMLAAEMAPGAAIRDDRPDNFILATELGAAYSFYEFYDSQIASGVVIGSLTQAASRAKTPINRRRIARMLFGVRLIVNQFGDVGITSEQSADLMNLERDYQSELNEIRNLDQKRYQPQLSQVQNIRKNCEPYYIELLGERLWRKLDDGTRRSLIAAEDTFQTQSVHEGDLGNFEPIPIALCSAIFNEALVRLRTKLPTSIEIRTLWPLGEKNFGTFVKFIEKLERPDDPSLRVVMREIARLRIDLPGLISLKGPMSELNRLRNSAAHERIDRERTVLLRAEWLREGQLLRRLLTALHPT